MAIRVSSYSEAERSTDGDLIEQLLQLSPPERENVLWDWYFVGMSRVRCLFLRFMVDVRNGSTIADALHGSFAA
jgi:hypothetical protein